MFLEILQLSERQVHTGPVTSEPEHQAVIVAYKQHCASTDSSIQQHSTLSSSITPQSAILRLQSLLLELKEHQPQHGFLCLSETWDKYLACRHDVIARQSSISKQKVRRAKLETFDAYLVYCKAER